MDKEEFDKELEKEKRKLMLKFILLIILFVWFLTVIPFWLVLLFIMGAIFLL